MVRGLLPSRREGDRGAVEGARESKGNMRLGLGHVCSGLAIIQNIVVLLPSVALLLVLSLLAENPQTSDAHLGNPVPSLHRHLGAVGLVPY